MANSEKLIFVAVLSLIPLGFTFMFHRRSGESLWHLHQIDRRGSAFWDLVAILLLILFLCIILPAFGRTGPPWRRPPFLVECALHLPLILPVAVTGGFLLSLIRRLFRSLFTGQSPNHRLQLTGSAREVESVVVDEPSARAAGN